MTTKTTSTGRWRGWLVVLALIGAGVLLAMWLGDGAPGWRFLVNGMGSLALIMCVATLANVKDRPTVYLVAMLTFLALAWAGAWWLLRAVVALVVKGMGT